MSHESVPITVPPSTESPVAFQQDPLVLAKVASFAHTPEREFAAGPDIQKATGMTHQKVMEAGYSTYGDLEARALAWEAEQAAREQTFTRTEIGAEKEAIYQAEMNDYRMKRDAAKQRVEGISYRKKLQNGGEIGLKRNPDLAKKLHSEAVAEAAAEGFSVGHLEPRYYPVTEKPEAEARTADLARMLREHDAEVLSAQAKKSNPEQAPADLTDDLIDSEPFIDASPKGLRARTRRIMSKARAALNKLNKSLDELIVGSIVEHPEVKLDDSKHPKKTLKDGVKSAYALAGTAVTLGVNRTHEYFSDQEKGKYKIEKGKRRKIVAAVVGVAVVAGTVYLASRGLSNSGGNSGGAHEATKGHTGGHGNSPSPVASGTGHGVENHPPKAVIPTTVRLHEGDTIWNEEKLNLIRHGNVHPTNAQIYEATKHALDANGLTWEEAKELHVGAKVKL